MDFLDPKKRRTHRIKLFIGYGLMAIVLTFASIILLYQAFGYDYDAETGGIVRNGMIFVDAHPAGANVYLNGKAKGRTGLRLDVKSGDYTLELQEEGYRSWQRSFNLEGGSIEQYVYPFLFPTTPDTSDTQAYTTNPSLVTQSPNREWLLIQQPGGFQRLDRLNIADESVETSVLSLPSSLMATAGATHQLATVEWSTDNRHLILSHRHDGGLEYLLIDTEDITASVNLTKAFDASFTNITLRDKAFDQYYLHDAATQNLYTAQLEEPAAKPFLTGVLAFRPHGNDEVAYITGAEAEPGQVWLKVREGTVSYGLRQIKAGANYLIDLARFSNSWYVAAASAAEDKAYLFRNPVAELKRNSHELPLPIAVLRTRAVPEFLSFSANTRFVALQSGGKLAVYDAETDRQYRYDTGLALTAGQRLEWMDGHRLVAVVNGRTVVMDYDGINKQELTEAINGYVPLFDRDYEAMYTLSGTTAGTPALRRTELRVQR